MEAYALAVGALADPFETKFCGPFVQILLACWTGETVWSGNPLLKTDNTRDLWDRVGGMFGLHDLDNVCASKSKSLRSADLSALPQIPSSCHVYLACRPQGKDGFQLGYDWWGCIGN